MKSINEENFFENPARGMNRSALDIRYPSHADKQDARCHSKRDVFYDGTFPNIYLLQLRTYKLGGDVKSMEICLQLESDCTSSVELFKGGKTKIRYKRCDGVSTIKLRIFTTDINFT